MIAARAGVRDETTPDAVPGIRCWTFDVLRRPDVMRILSGIQPSGVLHIGNYSGMMRPAIALQPDGEPFYFIADTTRARA